MKKIYAAPSEPHPWFDAFEAPEERALRAEEGRPGRRPADGGVALSCIPPPKVGVN